MVVVVGRQDRARRRSRGSRRWRRRRSLRAPRGRASAPGGADRDLAPVDAEDRVPAPRLLEVVGGDDDRRGLRRPASAISASRRSAAGRSSPVKGSSISSTRASWTRARAIRTRWRWPPESSPKVSPASSAEPDPAERLAAPPRARARPAAATRAAARAPPSSPPRGPRRGSRAASARSAGTEPQEASTRSVPGQRPQLAEQRPQDRRLAAAVGPEQGQPLARRAARRRRRRRPAGRRRSRAARPRRPRSGAQRGIRASLRVKPRTIASALAASISR